ncbi:MAG: hypothetical protein K1X79_06255 [Oligoflexia bacterium]|nr:hypothetical protein [Oligoflexia bacterium]
MKGSSVTRIVGVSCILALPLQVRAQEQAEQLCGCPKAPVTTEGAKEVFRPIGDWCKCTDGECDKTATCTFDHYVWNPNKRYFDNKKSKVLVGKWEKKKDLTYRCGMREYAWCAEEDGAVSYNVAQPIPASNSGPPGVEPGSQGAPPDGGGGGAAVPNCPNGRCVKPGASYVPFSTLTAYSRAFGTRNLRRSCEKFTTAVARLKVPGLTRKNIKCVSVKRPPPAPEPILLSQPPVSDGSPNSGLPSGNLPGFDPGAVNPGSGTSPTDPGSNNGNGGGSSGNGGGVVVGTPTPNSGPTNNLPPIARATGSEVVDLDEDEDR